jgi:hypothetical protein
MLCNVHIYAGLQQLLLPVQVVVYIVIVDVNGGLSGEVDARGAVGLCRRVQV